MGMRGCSSGMRGKLGFHHGMRGFSSRYEGYVIRYTSYFSVIFSMFFLTKVLGIVGGAGKRKKPNNPFEDEVVEYAQQADQQAWADSWTACLTITQMTTVDVEGMLAQASRMELDGLIHHLTTGKAHHIVKVNEIPEMLPFARSMKRVIKLNENGLEKFCRLMGKKLWDLGTEHGSFKMEVLTSYIKGVKSKTP